MASDPPKPTPPSQDEPWRKLGEYKIVGDIAEGTFGMVKGTQFLVKVMVTRQQQVDLVDGHIQRRYILLLELGSP